MGRTSLYVYQRMDLLLISKVVTSLNSPSTFVRESMSTFRLRPPDGPCRWVGSKQPGTFGRTTVHGCASG